MVDADQIRWPLRRSIQRIGLTQIALAKRIGKDQGWVSKLVNGWIEPNDEDVAKLSAVFGHNPLREEDNMRK